MLKFKQFFMGIMLLIPALAYSAVNTQDPYQKTEIAAKKIFNTINSQAAAIKKNPEILKDIVKQDLLPEVHVKYAGALVLGNYYQKLTDQEKKAFFSAFEDYLVQAFAQALSMYDGQKYEIAKPEAIGDKTLLSIRVSLLPANSSQQAIRLDFQWRKNSRTGEWQAYDMVAEGVSMITTKQSEWANTLRTKGINDLIEQLKEQSRVKIDPNAPMPK